MEDDRISDDVLAKLHGLFENERDGIANAANCAAVLFHGLADVNWAGFYLWNGEELVLGPFAGRPACVRIGLGRGVCGTAAAERRTVVVADVHAFPGHIACDSASASEIVVPLLRGDELLGVLDVDSPRHGRFGPQEQALLEHVARMWVASCG